MWVKKFVVIQLNETYQKPSRQLFSFLIHKITYHLILFRLKQLYDKFDDVVASGRMIAKVSDTTDGSASSSLVNGKKKGEKNSIMLYITDTA